MAKHISLCWVSFLFSPSTAAAFQQGKIPPTPFPGGPPPGESHSLWRMVLVVGMVVI